MNIRTITPIAALIVLLVPSSLWAETTADLPATKLKLDPAIRKELVRTGEKIGRETTHARADHNNINDLWKKLEAVDAAGDEHAQQEAAMALADKLRVQKGRLKNIDEQYVRRDALAQQQLREATPREDLPPALPPQAFTDAAREWAEKALPQLSPAKRKAIRGRIEADMAFNGWAKLDSKYSAVPGINALSTTKDLVDVIHGAHAARESIAKYDAIIDIQLNILDNYAVAKGDGDPRGLGAFSLGEAVKPAEKIFKRQNRRQQDDVLGNPYE